MRRSITAGAAAMLLVLEGEGATLAQDDSGGVDVPDVWAEIPDAGLAITTPDVSNVDIRRDHIEVVLPSEYADASSAVGWSVLLASMPGTEGFCSLTMFEGPAMGELSVTPEGRVFGSSSYGPELLDCSDA